jgi:hypothetical protein
MIEKIVHESACPVIALIHAHEPAFVREDPNEASSPTSPTAREDWQSATDIVLRRFTDYKPRGAFGRRALTERAKAS